MAVFEEEDREEEEDEDRCVPNGGSPRKPRPFRPFRSHEEYLYAMKEDLAEWLQSLYGLPVTAEDFMERLETGSLLCAHANRITQAAGASLTSRPVTYRAEVQPGTFHARDNVHNFIEWCRGALRVKECLLFETDDLVLRKNEKNVVLCLLEVARRGHAHYGLPAPVLVQMEREIDEEIAQASSSSAQQRAHAHQPPASLALRRSSRDEGHEADDEGEQRVAAPQYARSSPQQQIVTNDLRSLHERVAELLNRCSCPAQFPMIRVGDGKYRIGETQLLIFVRILRNHVMVRVGGGWDTLEHYLDKHDPCRCKSGRRISVNRVSPSSSGSIQVHLNSHNRPFSSSGGTSSSSRSSSVPTSPPSRRRSLDAFASPFHHHHTTTTQVEGNGWGGRQRGGVGKAARPNSSGADSSSEISSEAETLVMMSRRQRRYSSPRKVMRLGEEESQCSEEADSSLDHAPSSRSRIPTSQSPSPRHRCRAEVDPVAFGRRLSASRSETSLFQSAVNRGSRTHHHHPATPRRGGVMTPRPRSSSSTRTASSSPAGTPEWRPAQRRTLSLQSSPVKPVPPLLEEILNDSEVLDSDEKILERMERLISAYRAKGEDTPTATPTSSASAKGLRRNSLSKIPVLTWHARQ